ncbi:MAG: Octanoyltransferase LipM [Phycisphaerae bacterium]|nr:Octanoyltransferase LipM [Phycisphaerae bacterium]
MRLLIDDPRDGATNMARDEALLTRVGERKSPATLRFYQWDPPTISLGYFQKYAEYEELPPPAGELAIVRRTTGGGAILHDREWTYSIILPVDHDLLKPAPTRLYERVHDAIIDTLGLVNIRARRCGISDSSSAHQGPFFCFARRHCLDVLIEGQKLVGSAQRRIRQAVLQHGSIMLANRFDQHPVTSVQDHTALRGESLLEPLLEALQRHLSSTLEPDQWRDEELRLTEQLIAKYTDDTWLKRF